MAHDSFWVSVVKISNNAKEILNHNDYFNVVTYWLKCLDSYWWGVEFIAVSEHQILDAVFSQWRYSCNNVITFVLMFLFFCQWYFWTGFPRFMRWYIYDENFITLNVFRLRIVNSICTSSDEDTGEKWILVNDQCRRNSSGRRWGNWPYPT